MEYGKPEIIALGDAANAIQFGNNKQNPLYQDAIQGLPDASQLAYEADE